MNPTPGDMAGPTAAAPSPPTTPPPTTVTTPTSPPGDLLDGLLHGRNRQLARAAAIAVTILADWVIRTVGWLAGADFVVLDRGDVTHVRYSVILIFGTSVATVGWLVITLLERLTVRARGIWTAGALSLLTLSGVPIVYSIASMPTKISLAIINVTTAAIVVPVFRRTVVITKRRSSARNTALFVFLIACFYADFFVWSRFYTFDPGISSSARESVGRELSPLEHPWYYPWLITHIIGATIALAGCSFQVWPWLRRRYPAVHRWSGRVYIFAGVVPGALSGLVVEAFWPFSISTAFQQVALSLLWLGVTGLGLYYAIRRNTTEHRRWMIRSFALTASVIIETAIRWPIEEITRGDYDTLLAGNNDVFQQITAVNDNWMGLVLAILLSEGYLELERRREIAVRREPTALQAT